MFDPASSGAVGVWPGRPGAGVPAERPCPASLPGGLVPGAPGPAPLPGGTPGPAPPLERNVSPAADHRV
jgi:hypothetical protein